MKTFLKNNINFFVYLFFAVLIESFILYSMTKNIFISFPWFSLSLAGIIFSIHNLIKKRAIKNVLLYISIIIQSMIGLFCHILFETTGTLFEFSMIRLINEAKTFSGVISANYFVVIFIAIILIFFFLLTSYFNKYIDKYYRVKFSVITSFVCLSVFLVSHIFSTISINKRSEKNFLNSLYMNSNFKYNQLGYTGNFINEIYKMIFSNQYNELNEAQIDKFIYKETNTPTSVFGISQNNNLITILVESFEWFPFISNPDIYPNGTNLTEEQLDFLYPNLREFYNMSLVMNNHYSQNKTDISETEALLGSYPSSDYINYGFPKSSQSSSIAHSLKQIDNSIITNYFHNNIGSFYNRNTTTHYLGYDNLYFIEQMSKKGVTNYMDSNQPLAVTSNINLDSEMINSMKDYMFLTNQRFNTHITTISMHGDYVYKENMKHWYNKFDSLNINIYNNELKNYLVTVMEFDYALGLLLNDLKEKDLLGNTTIVLFSDHNVYLNNLSNYVKDIYKYSDKNYNELFRVPLMIYDPNIEHQIINKFTTTYDITPTLLDMFGINYYTNLYYGNSIFSDVESVIYSKVFDVFIADGLFFSNINNIFYKDNWITNEYIKKVEIKCLSLLKKIYYINHIFNYNYLKPSNSYFSKFRNLNNK